MFRGQKRHLCPIFREFIILFSGNEVLPNFKSPNSFTYVRRPPSECPKSINGVESLSFVIFGHLKNVTCSSVYLVNFKI